MAEHMHLELAGGLKHLLAVTTGETLAVVITQHVIMQLLLARELQLTFRTPFLAWNMLFLKNKMTVLKKNASFSSKYDWVYVLHEKNEYI